MSYGVTNEDSPRAAASSSATSSNERRTIEARLETRYVSAGTAEAQASSVRDSLRAVSATERKLSLMDQQGAYTSQLFLLRLDLTSFDQIPSSFDQHVFVEFTMPATSVSHTTVRSISVSNENPPEKYVRYLSKHEYRVEIELQTGEVPPSETEISSLAAVAQQAGPYEPPVTATATAAAAAATTSDDSD
ncbi:hypothetical protein HPB50_024275 [Hyalomma asiaticum]|uniref:Uncharacterized protein n=1 Tax=Hyalomma asiaticum TaxID=266040 RepID=A0ACB7RWD7_HYAAI|nr:hypothetical protein HPB50_024275 [Hyalomma asiaticum]